MNNEQNEIRIQILEVVKEIFQKADVTDTTEPDKIMDALVSATNKLLSSADMQRNERIKPEF